MEPTSPRTTNRQLPLIRDQTSHTIRAVGSKQIRKIVHNPYAKTGLLKKPKGRMYDLRTHSLRKYFKTQITALGVKTDHIDYMMDHTISTYHDIQSLGTEKLRQIHAASGLSIKPKPRTSKINALKEIIHAWISLPNTSSPEKHSPKKTPHTNPEPLENQQLQILTNTLRNLIKHQTIVQIRSADGGPAGN